MRTVFFTRASSVSPLYYRNTIFNQSAIVFSWDSFLITFNVPFTSQIVAAVKKKDYTVHRTWLVYQLLRADLQRVTVEQ